MSTMAALGRRHSRGRNDRVHTAILAAAIASIVGTAGAAEPAPVDFARQVRPILAESCFECHGPDPRGRKGDLRLDSRDDVFADRGGYSPGRPGPSRESELIDRITLRRPRTR